MKRILSIIVLLSCTLLGLPLNAQSFSELLNAAESAKVKYGETDSRYLDALSSAIVAASDEGKNEEANKYRLLHSEIVKSHYGENSVEYAEDIWRLGNVSEYKGSAYQFDCYKRVQRILESIDAKDSFIYFDLFWQFFWHYWNEQKWLQASINMKKYIEFAKPWINKEWKGNVISEGALANAYYLLGLTYFSRLQNYSSAIEAFQKCAIILEENNLIADFPYTLATYQGIWLGYENLKDYSSSLEWHVKCVGVAEQIKGETSDEYINELSSLRYCYYSLNDYENAKRTNLELLSRIEKRDRLIDVNIINDSLYVEEYSSLVSLGAIFNKYSDVVSYGAKLVSIYQDRGETVSSSYWLVLDNMIFAYHIIKDYLSEYSLYDQYEAISEKLDLKRTEKYWNYLASKSETLTYLFKFAEYETAIREWGELTKELYRENSRQALTYEVQVAAQYESRDQHENAKAIIDNCYRIIDSGQCVFDGEADSLLFMSVIHNTEGMAYTSSDIQRAEKALMSAVEENQLIGRNDCAAQLNLGLLYYQQKRDINKARLFFEEALHTLERVGDNYSMEYITVLNNLGLCYNDLGLSSYAIAIFDLASQSVLANYGKQHVLYGTTEQNKSLFYTNISNYPEAINCCIEAIENYRYLYGENSEKYGMALQNLGMMYQYVGEFLKSNLNYS